MSKITQTIRNSDLIFYKNDPKLVEDFAETLLGKQIGSGTSRDVYEYLPNPEDWVIKVETFPNGANMEEFRVWTSADYKVRQWLAPVKWISPHGRLLVMGRTKEFPKRTRPTKIPRYLFDVNHSNFGWMGNNFVCHDYETIGNIEFNPEHLKTVEW